MRKDVRADLKFHSIEVHNSLHLVQSKSKFFHVFNKVLYHEDVAVFN
jgi:hypothetical protein